MGVTARIPPPIRDLLSGVDPFGWSLLVGAVVFSLMLACSRRAQDRGQAVAFAELDALLPEALRERPARLWPWALLLPVYAIGAYGLLRLEPTVAADGVGEARLFDVMLAAGAFAAGCVGAVQLARTLRTAEAWRGDGGLRLAVKPRNERSIGESTPVTLHRRTDPAPLGWAVWAFIGIGAFGWAPAAIGSLFYGERDDLYLWCPAFFIPQWIAAIVRNRAGLPGDDAPAVAAGGIAHKQRFVPWSAVFAYFRAPAPDDRVAVAVVTPAGCEKFLLAPNAVPVWDELIARRRPDLAGA